MSAPSKPRPKRRAKAVIFWLLLVLVGAYIASVLIPPPQVILEVSPDTTFFTEPLREDGTVDLAAAINQRNGERFGEGTNAAVYIARAFDIGQSTGDRSAELTYKALALPWPAEKAPYLPLRVYAEQRGTDDDGAYEFQRQLDSIVVQPWTSDEHPDLVEWIEANAAAVQMIEAAASSDYYLWPIAISDEPDATLFDVRYAPLGDIREAAGIHLALALRADSSESTTRKWNHVITVARLGRLIADGNTMVDRLVAASLVSKASETATVLLQGGDLSEGLAKWIGQQLAELQPWPDMHLAYTHETRLAGVSAFQSLYRQQLTGDLSGDDEAGRFALFDVNAALRRADVWYDRVDAAFTQPTFRLRYGALGDVMSDFEKVIETWRDDNKALLVLGLTCTPSPVKQRIATDRVYRLVMAITMPDISRAILLDGNGRVRVALLQTAIALHRYQLQAGRYPESLDALVPEFLDALPIDLFSDEPLIYRREGDGFVLYSVGPNFIDDGGVTAEKAIFDNPHDIVIRIGVDNNAADPTDTP